MWRQQAKIQFHIFIFACWRHIWGLMTKIQYGIESSGRGGDFEVLIVQFGPLGRKLQLFMQLKRWQLSSSSRLLRQACSTMALHKPHSLLHNSFLLSYYFWKFINDEMALISIAGIGKGKSTVVNRKNIKNSNRRHFFIY